MGRRSAGPSAHPIIGEGALSFVLAPHPGGGQKEWISGEVLAIVGQGLALLALDARPPIKDGRPCRRSRSRLVVYGNPTRSSCANVKRYVFFVPTHRFKTMNDHAHIEEFEQRIRTIASLAKTHRETYDAWLDMLDEPGWLEPNCAQQAKNNLLLAHLAGELGLIGPR